MTSKRVLITICGQLVQSIGISPSTFASEYMAHITLLGQESCMSHVWPYIPPRLTCYRCCAKHVKRHIVFTCFCVSLPSKGLNRERTSTLFCSYHNLLDIMPKRSKRHRQLIKNGHTSAQRRRWKKQKLDNQESSAGNQDQVSESSVIKSNDSKDKNCKYEGSVWQSVYAQLQLECLR